jgi:hypothetical protein
MDMMASLKRAQGGHNPNQKSLRRWDTEGGAPKGRGAKRARDPAQLDVRMSPDELNSLDAWISTQPAPRPTRAEAIRRIVKDALSRGVRSKKSAAKAREMAGQEIDRRLDEASIPPGEERARRKRRLTKGPSEFREMRDDIPTKPKG